MGFKYLVRSLKYRSETSERGLPRCGQIRDCNQERIANRLCLSLTIVSLAIVVDCANPMMMGPAVGGVGGGPFSRFAAAPFASSCFPGPPVAQQPSSTAAFSFRVWPLINALHNRFGADLALIQVSTLDGAYISTSSTTLVFWVVLCTHYSMAIVKDSRRD